MPSSVGPLRRVAAAVLLAFAATAAIASPEVGKKRWADEVKEAIGAGAKPAPAAPAAGTAATPADGAAKAAPAMADPGKATGGAAGTGTGGGKGNSGGGSGGGAKGNGKS